MLRVSDLNCISAIEINEKNCNAFLLELNVQNIIMRFVFNAQNIFSEADQN